MRTTEEFEAEDRLIEEQLAERKRSEDSDLLEIGGIYCRLYDLYACHRHGQWETRVIQIGFHSPKTAGRYRKAAIVFGGFNSDTLAGLTRTAIYFLAEEVLKWQEDGARTLEEAKDTYQPYRYAIEQLEMGRKINKPQIERYTEEWEQQLDIEAASRCRDRDGEHGEEVLGDVSHQDSQDGAADGGQTDSDPEGAHGGGDGDQAVLDTDEHGGGDEAEQDGDGAGDSSNPGTSENRSDPTATESGESVDDDHSERADAENQELLTLAGDITEAVEELKGDGIFIESADGHLKFGPDIYNTPPEAVDILVPFLPRGIVVWECASGDRHIANRLLGYDFSVTESDIRRGTNFLTCDPPDFDVIVTNPPWSKATEFVTRCYDLEKPFALLMPITALESAPRQEQFKKGLELLIPDRRIRFIDPYGKVGNSPPCLSAWFCWGLLPAPHVFAPLPSP